MTPITILNDGFTFLTGVVANSVKLFVPEFRLERIGSDSSHVGDCNIKLIESTHMRGFNISIFA